MRTNRIFRALAVLLAAVTVLSFAGCGEMALLFTELPAADVQQWKTGDPITQTKEMLGLEQMKQVASQGGLTLYMNEKTTEIAVKTADGTVWFSNPQNRLDLNASSLGRYSSPLLVTAIDSAETSKQMNAFDDSVKYGQYTIQSIQNGVRVEYHFGQVVKTPLYPQVLTKERFDELLEGLTKAEQNNMKRYYLEVNYDTVTDQQALKNLEEQYTKIKEVQHIYALKQSPSALETNRITAYFTKLAYTQEMRDADHAAVGYTDPDKAKGNFLLPVEYTLADGRLNVRIPVADIRVTSNLKLDTVTLLPFMNTAAGLTNSQAVVPDGSGAIIHLSQVRSGNTAEYAEGFYGRDYALYQLSQAAVKKNLYLPVYGITAEEGAMLAVIGQADATASLYAAARGSAQDIGAIGARFKLLDYAQVKLTNTDTNTVNSYPDKSIEDDIAVDYTFLDKSRNQWTDVAATYRIRLQKEGKLTGSAGATLPVMVNLVGAIDDKAPVLGIPREILRPLTTFSQAGDIADRLAEAFGGDRLVIRYSGWRKGGLKSSVLTGFDPEGKLGGAKGLGALADKLQGMNARLFPDADFQYVYRDKLFDGFSSSKDVVRFITSESAYKPAYNKATFVPDADGLFGYILEPTRMAGHVDSFLKAVKDKGLSGFSLPYIGADLSSNFNKDAFMTRNAAAAYSAEVMQKLRDAGYGILSTGVNAYALPLLDVAVAIPTDCNTHPMLSRSVPFTQMVLSGSVQYAAEELNRAADDRYYLLKCIETGSAMYVSAIAAANSEVKDTAYDELFAVNFDTLEPRIKEVGSQLIEALSPVYGRAMVGHTQLTDGVVRVDYEGGKSLYINYNQSEAATDAGTVPAAGWLLAEKEG